MAERNMSIAGLAYYVSCTNYKLQLQSILPVWTHARSNNAEYSPHISRIRKWSEHHIHKDHLNSRC